MRIAPIAPKRVLGNIRPYLISLIIYRNLHLDRTDVKLNAIDNRAFDPIGRSWAINLKPNDSLCGCGSGFLNVMSCGNFCHGASFRHKSECHSLSIHV